MFRCCVALILPMLIAGCQPAATNSGAGDSPKVAYLNSADDGRMSLPFSEAVRVGGLLFLSGMIGNRPGTPELAPGGIEGETRQAFQNIEAALKRHGSSLDRVVKCTVFLADMDEWSRMNDVYVGFFPGPKPARSALGTSGLALGARVEIECIATMGDTESS